VKKINLAPVKIPAGAWQMPVLRYVATDGTADPGIAQLVFAAGTQLPSGQPELTIGLPISGLDAAALLHTLQQLQANGLIPVVPQVPRGRQ
jgi:hypothetical protein